MPVPKHHAARTILLHILVYILNSQSLDPLSTSAYGHTLLHSILSLDTPDILLGHRCDIPVTPLFCTKRQDGHMHRYEENAIVSIPRPAETVDSSLTGCIQRTQDAFASILHP